jgi:two-component system cell cycle sensor histidine kinase/response regulator CckA
MSLRVGSGQHQRFARHGINGKDGAAMASSDDGKTILLAEDGQLVRNLVLTVLQQSGYNVITGVDGQDALEKSRQFKGTIDLLLSDVNMPHMNGIELAKQMRIERPVIRVLLMSSMAAGQLPPNEGWQFLRKPFMCAMLKETVKHLLQDGNPARQALTNNNPEFSSAFGLEMS